MQLAVFDGQNKSELSMIEVAEAILNERGVKNIIDFNQLYKEVCEYLGYSEEEAKAAIAQFYTDLNIDGRFISLGENRWGLRSWYPVDSIDEEVNHGDDEQPRRRKRTKKVNVFMDNDENAIDYSNDDPEDSDLDDQNDELYDEDNDDEEMADLSDVNESAHENIEDDLTIINHEDINRDSEDY